MLFITPTFYASFDPLRKISQMSEKTSEIDRSQRLGEEVTQTLKALEDYFGK